MKYIFTNIVLPKALPRTFLLLQKFIRNEESLETRPFILFNINHILTYFKWSHFHINIYVYKIREHYKTFIRNQTIMKCLRLCRWPLLLQRFIGKAESLKTKSLIWYYEVNIKIHLIIIYRYRILYIATGIYI